MKIEQQVCSLELSKRLKELGVKQESAFQWIPYPDGSVRLGEWYLQLVPTRAGKGIYNMTGVSAYTVAELGELLPTEQKDRLGFFSGKAINGWFCEVKNYGVMPFNRLHVELQHDTEADARAKMLVYLIENELVSV